MIIYKITNDINNKIYIGQTTKTLSHRKQAHLMNVKRGVQTHLCNAIRKYGEEHFIFEEIEQCTSLEELNNREKYWIEYYDSIKNGYNMIPGGKTNPMDVAEIVEKHNTTMKTPEVRHKISTTMQKNV